MMNHRIGLFGLLFFGLLATTGCSGLLFEGNTDAKLLEYQKHPTNYNLADLSKTYDAMVKNSQKRGITQPGLYADYGVALALLGKNSDANKMFNNEVACFPNSARYVRQLKLALVPEYVADTTLDTTTFDIDLEAFADSAAASAPIDRETLKQQREAEKARREAEKARREAEKNAKKEERALIKEIRAKEKLQRDQQRQAAKEAAETQKREAKAVREQQAEEREQMKAEKEKMKKEAKKQKEREKKEAKKYKEQQRQEAKERKEQQREEERMRKAEERRNAAEERRNAEEEEKEDTYEE